MRFLLSMISGAIESIWRRWFGGWVEGTMKNKLPKWLYKILASRGTQTIFNLIVLFGIFMINAGWMVTPFSAWLIAHNISAWIIALIMTAIVQFEFWSRGHGPAFDVGRWNPQEYVERYQKVWWASIPNKIIPREHWYGFLYDFIWMLIRYTYGLIFLVPFLWSFKILWLGLVVTGLYAFCWTIYERDSWIIKYIPFQMVGGATQLAELLVGFAVGFALMWM